MVVVKLVWYQIYIEYIQESNSYILKGNMSINSNEDTFKYNVEARKSKDGYYKVSLRYQCL